MREVFGWIRSITFAVVFALVLGIFVFQPFKVDGHSMDPTLQDEQRIYVSKLSHTFSYLPDYGEIVVIDSRVERDRTFMDDVLGHPLLSLISGKADDHMMYVKRVIGRPGDVLEFKDNKVYRNGEALNEPYIKETMDYVTEEKLIVPADHIFVMGDNRNHSTDSRDIGFIPLDHIMGTMIENPLKK